MMTKKILLGIAFVASVAACTDDYKDWTTPQVVPAPDAVSFGNGSVSPVDVIVFADIADQQTVKVCDITAPTASDSTYTPSYTITLGAQTYDIDGTGTMAVSDLKSYVDAVYGKAPVQRDIQATVSAWLDNGNVSVKTADSDTFEISVLPDAPEIAESYYIVGGPLDWAASAASKELKFSHSSQNVYDDPIFTITFPAAGEGDTWFAIGDEAACDAIANNEDGAWSKLFGTTSGNGNSGTSGNLARRTELSDDGSFKVESGAKYIQVTINMMEYTYEVKALNFDQFVYFAGSTDWSAADQKLESADFDGVYTGFLYMTNNGNAPEFKFQKVSGDWGSELNSATFAAGVTGDLEAGEGTGNLKATAGEGIYYVRLDLVAGTLHGTKINNMNLVGGFNDWNPADDACQMTWDAENYCYVITDAKVMTTEWKFTANNDWGINLGGDVNALTLNGGNIQQEGTTIKLYPTRKTSDNIYCTIE